MQLQPGATSTRECHAVTPVLPGLWCFSGWKSLHLELNSANDVRHNGNVRSIPLIFFVILYTSTAQRETMFRLFPFPMPPDLNSKPIHFSWPTW